MEDHDLAQIRYRCGFDPVATRASRAEFLVQRSELSAAGSVPAASFTRLSDVDGVLENFAAQPKTARHMAWRLAIHFHTDTPAKTLVSAPEAEAETGLPLARMPRGSSSAVRRPQIGDPKPGSALDRRLRGRM